MKFVTFIGRKVYKVCILGSWFCARNIDLVVVLAVYTYGKFGSIIYVWSFLVIFLSGVNESKSLYLIEKKRIKKYDVLYLKTEWKRSKRILELVLQTIGK